MAGRILIFGLGYTAARLAARMRAAGWDVAATRRAGGADALAFDSAEVEGEIARATHILSSVPPEGGADPVLERYGGAIRAAPAKWVGYLSSTGVYGDAQGAWVDETAPVGGGRRDARTAADLNWQGLRGDVRVFRLPGIYGPGRSPLERVRAGTAHRVDAPGQVFSRIHVDDIGSAVIASFDRGGPGVFNLADEAPASGNEVTEYACALLGAPPPPVVPVAALTPMARGFYAESRRVAATKMKRDLGLRLCYADYRAGLRACLGEMKQ